MTGDTKFQLKKRPEELFLFMAKDGHVGTSFTPPQKKRSPLYLVRAFATETGVILGQVRVSDSSKFKCDSPV